jgi:hypothetical protein
MGRSGFGFGLGLGGLLLLAAAPWLDVALHGLPYFLEQMRWVWRVVTLAVEIGLSGLAAGWFAFAWTKRIEGTITRIALMTLLVVILAVILALVFVSLIQPFVPRLLLFYLMALPIPCLVAVPLWAALYLWLAGPDSPLRPAQPPADMTRLLEDLRRDSPSLR